MIGNSRRVRVFAWPAPADLRQGFNGLFGMVKNGMKHDPLSGDLYLFVNRTRQTCKVLLWDGTGLCIFMKRLERGRFAAPWRAAGEGPLVLTTSELALFVEGCTLVGKTGLSPAEIRFGTLASDRMM